MKHKLMSLFQIILGTVFSFAMVGVSTFGQTSREREREINEQETELRSWNLKIISLNANKSKKSSIRPEEALAQVQDDFTRIQVINKNLVLSISQKRPLDYKFVSKSVTEIRKSSERLNENLALPEAEQIEPVVTKEVTNENQLKLAILRLGNLIYTFTKNPFFKQPTVLDTQETVKARRELLQIVDLSAQIKKDAERLEKTAP